MGKSLPVLLYLLFFVGSSLQAQQSKVDSLKEELDRSHPDSTRIEILNKLALERMYSAPQEARGYVKKGMRIAEEKELQESLGDLHHALGLYFFIQGEKDSCLEHWKKAKELRKASGATKAAIASLGNIGVVHERQGDLPKALEFYYKALQKAKEIEDTKLIANNYSNMGVVYSKQGDYPKALEHYFNSLQKAEELEDRKLMANNLVNIGSIYEEQEEYEKALDHYERALKIAKELGNKKLKGTILGNLGEVLQARGELSKAFKYHRRSLRSKEELGDRKGIAHSLDNIGTLYHRFYDRFQAGELSKDDLPFIAEQERPVRASQLLDSALFHQKEALRIRMEIDDDRGKTFSLNAIAEIHRKRGRPSKALSHIERSFAISDSLGSTSRKMEAAKGLYETYKDLKRTADALEWHERYTALKDSVFNEKKQKQLGKQEASYKFEKKLLERKKEREKERALAEARNQRQTIISYSAIGGLVMVLGFAILIGNRLRVTRRQKQLIEEQKSIVEEQKKTVEEQKLLVEEKNQEITDSINYAKRLQEAVLPPSGMLQKHLKEHFVLYKPKEIVSGDFYFMEVLGSGSKKLVYYVAADCTGHGVPGAMVSILGANGLKRCIQEFELKDPGDILQKLSELVAENFYQSGEEKIRDGMDLALCCLEYENGTAQKVHFAGANNPLWIINPSRKEWPEPAVPFKQEGGAEIEATRKAIGYSEDPEPFNSQSFELQEGDSLYTFSDGYPDQFGGEKGKKFKTAQFKELLIEIHGKPMEEQERILDERFENWRGDLEQIDDVCVFGVRV